MSCQQTCHLDENRRCRDCGHWFPLEEPQDFRRPPREDYVRVTHTAHGYTLEPAVEWRDGDDFTASVNVLRSIVGEVAVRPLGGVMDRAHECAKIIVRCWPDRAYFVEVWQEGREGFAQVFQPFGVPRNR